MSTGAAVDEHGPDAILQGREPGAHPYLSVVAATRNDDHGGNPLYRTQVFVNGLIESCDKHRVPTELILVEWNPPADRPRLAEVLSWPVGQGWCSVRIIEVPNALHSGLEYSDRLPLYQMIAKNVGIRRADGEFVVATNIDILFSDRLMHFISQRRLRHGYVYRADRCDVPAEIDPDGPLDQKLAFCARSVIRANRREGTFDLRSGIYYRVYRQLSVRSWLRNSTIGNRLSESRAGRLLGLDKLAFAAPVPHSGFVGRFQDWAVASAIWRSRVRRELWAIVRTVRYVLFPACVRVYQVAYWVLAGLNHPRQIPARTRRLSKRIANRIGVTPRSTAGASGAWSLLAFIGAVAIATLAWIGTLFELFIQLWDYERSRVRLYTNASGDFTMMAREDWMKTHGYLELEMYSMHIDGLQLYIAHYNGIRERTFPSPVFHIEHEGGFRPEATKEVSLEATLARRAIPQITMEELRDWIFEMYRTRRPPAFNRDDWGYAGVDLQETDPYSSREAVTA